MRAHLRGRVGRQDTAHGGGAPNTAFLLPACPPASVAELPAPPARVVQREVQHEPVFCVTGHGMPLVRPYRTPNVQRRVRSRETHFRAETRPRRDPGRRPLYETCQTARQGSALGMATRLPVAVYGGVADARPLPTADSSPTTRTPRTTIPGRRPEGRLNPEPRPPMLLLSHICLAARGDCRSPAKLATGVGYWHPRPTCPSAAKDAARL